MRPLRWGVLGTAHINRLLIPAIRATGRSAVHAVASRSAERAAAYAAEWDIPRGFAAYDALLHSADVDIVYVPLPNSLHVPWTIRALECGKHVLCEKPLALAPSDVDRVADAASRSGRVATEGFMYRHHAMTLRVQELLANGTIGGLRSIDGLFTYSRSRERDVRLDPELGGGALWDVGCYPVSYANLIAGAAPESVRASQQLGSTGVDEEFAGTISYANGVVANIHASFRADYRTSIRLTGSDGAIEIDRPFRPDPSDHLRIVRGGSVERVDVAGSPMFVDEVRDMEDAALGVRAPRLTLGESRLLAVTITALAAAARAEHRVVVGDPAQ
jgi:predicted dehydrogenase